MRVVLAGIIILLTFVSSILTLMLLSAKPSGASTAVMSFCLNTPPQPLFSSCPNATANTPYYCDINASDEWEGQPHVFELNTSLLTINASTGEVSFNPTSSDIGTYHINVTSKDMGCGYNISSGLWVFQVMPMNDSDILILWDTSDLTTIYKYEPVTIWANYTNNETNQSILANCTLSTDDNRTINMSYDTNKSIYWATLSPGFVQGSHDYTVMCDGRKSGYGIRVNTSSLFVTNRPPVLIAPFPNITMRQGSRVSGYNLYDYFMDPDLDPLTFTSSDPSNIHITIDVGGSVTITPDPWWSGTRIATFTAFDGYNQTDSNVFTITVLPTPESEVPPSSGGGGGGGGVQIICIENWECSDWSACMPTGIRTRSCQDLSQCNTTRNKPPEVENCTYVATCSDGIRNCHDGACESRVDCGGPCEPCPSCYDGIKNQGEEDIDCGGPCKPCERNETLEEATVTLPYTPPSEPVGKRFPWLFILFASASFAAASSYAYQHAASLLSKKPALFVKRAATPHPTPEAHALVRLTLAKTLKDVARAYQAYLEERYGLQGVTLGEAEALLRKHESERSLRKSLVHIARRLQEALYTHARRVSVDDIREDLIVSLENAMRGKRYHDALNTVLKQPVYAREGIVKTLLHAMYHADVRVRTLLLAEALRVTRSLPAGKRQQYLSLLKPYLSTVSSP